GRSGPAHHESSWRRLRAIRGIGPLTTEKLAFEGQGRDDQLPAGDLAYVKLVGRLAGLGRRASEEEVRAFFAPYEPYRGLAGLYALRVRFLEAPPNTIEARRSAGRHERVGARELRPGATQHCW